MLDRNVTITPRPVPAHWSRLSTPELTKLARRLAEGNAYNRDTVLELVGALGGRLEEQARLLGTYR